MTAESLLFSVSALMCVGGAVGVLFARTTQRALPGLVFVALGLCVLLCQLGAVLVGSVVLVTLGCIVPSLHLLLSLSVPLAETSVRGLPWSRGVGALTLALSVLLIASLVGGASPLRLSEATAEFGGVASLWGYLSVQGVLLVALFAFIIGALLVISALVLARVQPGEGASGQ